ncbi:MAG: VapC toxin family PIN domain ribonuclease [Deltaproteobacteria bacterium]|nr:MAG: VapC toxin family PIN domain ribonuclease [Deltaproteobacteria bacterium]
MNYEVVIDNSVVISWCFADEANQYADNVLESLRCVRAIVPVIWPLEVGNVLVVAERKGRLRYIDCIQFWELLSELPIEVESQISEKVMMNVYTLARESQLSTYDASYLELAIRKNLPLATLDKALLGAARKFDIKIYNKAEHL